MKWIAGCVSLFLIGCNELSEIPDTPEFGGISSSLQQPSSSGQSSSSLSSPSSSSSALSSSSRAGIIYLNLSDSRDGNVYRTVRIGDHEWTVDNMRFLSPSDTSAVCPQNLSSCPSQGLLYDWYAATGNQASDSLPSGVKGVCPSGWHIPSDKEFRLLRLFAGDSLFAGYHLKAAQGWDAGSGSDLYGFGAIPVGYGDLDGEFYGIGNYAYFWSTTEMNDDEASIWYLGKHHSTFFVQPNFKELKASVRCVRDYSKTQ